jgi:hypothetical protein
MPPQADEFNLTARVSDARGSFDSRGECRVVGIATVIALICFVTLLSLTARGRPWSMGAI